MAPEAFLTYQRPQTPSSYESLSQRAECVHESKPYAVQLAFIYARGGLLTIPSGKLLDRSP